MAELPDPFHDKMLVCHKNTLTSLPDLPMFEELGVIQSTDAGTTNTQLPIQEMPTETQQPTDSIPPEAVYCGDNFTCQKCNRPFIAYIGTTFCSDCQK